MDLKRFGTPPSRAGLGQPTGGVMKLWLSLWLTLCISATASAARLSHQVVAAGSGGSAGLTAELYGVVGQSAPPGKAQRADGSILYSASLLMPSGIGAVSADDMDGDGTPDGQDAFPNDAAAQLDTDEDGVGNNADEDDDGDGVSDETEDGGEENRDGNSDGIADRLQRNVTSLKAYDSETYVTMVSPAGTTLTYCQAAGNPSTADAPGGVSFPLGFFDFTINGIAPGGATWLTLYLPEGSVPQTYYKYGRTPDDDNDHWYEFLYDGVATGAEIEDNVVTLHFVDGETDDDVLTPDSMVIDLGAPGFSGEGGGSGGGSSRSCFINTLF